MSAVPFSGETLTHEERSLGNFQEIYRKLDPAETARRCNLPFDGKDFSIRIMGTPCRAAFPAFELRDSEGREIKRGCEKILFIRYLCEGRYTASAGGKLSYREIPWGNLYYPNFEGRCIKRFAHAFGNDIEGFMQIMEGNGGLRAERLHKDESRGPGGATTHAAYRFEFCSGLFMTFLLWAADDEFPPSAQILFDDNFPPAFTAEDLAAACTVAVDYLQEMSAATKLELSVRC